MYHNVFRGKDVQKWVKSRITPFNDAATSVCQAMVQVIIINKDNNENNYNNEYEIGRTPGEVEVK